MNISFRLQSIQNRKHVQAYFQIHDLHGLCYHKLSLFSRLVLQKKFLDPPSLSGFPDYSNSLEFLVYEEIPNSICFEIEHSMFFK
jgi:hypothetical protein